MPQPNVFALRNSGLEPFLYAEVGTETNGSTLTVLSLLARLGLDPWAQAARWVDLPKAASIDSLAQSITRTPLAPAALANARATAARLIALLPLQTGVARASTGVELSIAGVPQWVPVALLGCALLFGLCVNLFVIPSRDVTAVPAPIEHTVPNSQ